MRLPALTVLALAASAAAGPAAAQTYDPHYAFCMHVYGDPAYFECYYMTMAACAEAVSGRSGQCVVNPFFDRSRTAAQPDQPR
jgi:ABC-type sugar transport system substrate-binding protein